MRRSLKPNASWWQRWSLDLRNVNTKRLLQGLPTAPATCSAPTTTEPDQDDQFWTVDDLESTDAPHAPVAVAYDERLVLFRDLSG